MQNGKVQVNPARLVRQRKENNGRSRFLSRDEENALRAVIQERFPHHLPEFDLTLHTGIRLSEQYGLTWDCVDFERRTLTIPQSKHGEIRYVTLNDDALAALRTVHAFRNEQPWVFLNPDGQRLKSPRKWFTSCMRAAKVENFSWHCLRHTFASRLIMLGAGLREVQVEMGHKTIAMTCR